MDPYMFSYTSGTTGDSKGVKMSHNMIVRQAMTGVENMEAQPNDAMISYLPYPHSFEQVLFAAALIGRCRIGFY